VQRDGVRLSHPARQFAKAAVTSSARPLNVGWDDRTIRVMRRRAAGLAIVVALAAGGASARASSELYDSYACTLQGTTGLTYIVEGATDANLTGACLAFKKALAQKELRWGLHPPSFSSGESWKATWINRKLKLKLNMLGVKVPELPVLIRAVSGILNADWKRSSMSYP